MCNTQTLTQTQETKNKNLGMLRKIYKNFYTKLMSLSAWQDYFCAELNIK